MLSPRATDVNYISPEKEVNAGLWTLFAGATLFLGLRLWCKVTRRTGLWYDDYMLVISWLVLMVTDIIITVEFATGYSSGYWDDRMHILINISSDGTLIGQALSKTALGITLLRMSDRKQSIILWFCIASMNTFMILKCFFQWAKYCGKDDYQNWYRIQGPCISYTAEEDIKVAGNTYNIIMDFIFACFPWWITWGLEMRRVEKIALCSTMSLGMFIAIISAVRTTWKDRPIMHTHDEYYIWRNGMSNIWYSAEVAGTIIVQCIPILRPLLRDVHTSLTSRKIGDTEDGHSVNWRGSRRSMMDAAKRASTTAHSNAHPGHNPDFQPLPPFNTTPAPSRSLSGKSQKYVEIIAMNAIPEEGRDGKESYTSSSASDTASSTPTIPSGPLMFGDTWRLSDGGSGRSDADVHSPQSATWIEGLGLNEYGDEHERKGLSPPPPRHRR